MRSYAACEDYGGPPPSVSDLPLFSQPEVRKLARRTDPETSRDAALSIVEHLTELQQAVLTAYQDRGKMTAKECADLPEFKELGFSTARKRVSELAQRGRLRETGIKRAGCMEYEVSEAKDGDR